MFNNGTGVSTTLIHIGWKYQKIRKYKRKRNFKKWPGNSKGNWIFIKMEPFTCLTCLLATTGNYLPTTLAMKNQSACLRPPAALSTFPAAEDLSRLVSSSSDAPADDGERRKAAVFGSGRRISNINILPYLPTSLSFCKSLHGFQPSCWVCRNPRLDRLCYSCLFPYFWPKTSL